MKIQLEMINSIKLAVLESEELLITDVQSALDLMATVRYETDCDGMVLPMSAITSEFFDLKSKLAGDVLQKYTNYQLRLGIVGDFTSLKANNKSFNDFVFESHKGRNVCFAETVKEALERLAG